MVFISLLLFLVFTFLSALHFYWSFGGRWGSKALIPVKDDDTQPSMPGIIPTLTVALGLLVFGTFMLNQSFTIVRISDSANQFGLWSIAGIFILRAVGEFNYLGFFKKVRNTKFGQNDTKYYSPLCLTIGILSLLVIVCH